MMETENGRCAAPCDFPMNAAGIYELEVSKSSARCHYVDFRDKSIMKAEISVFGSQALGAERRKSPSLVVKVLKIYRTL